MNISAFTWSQDTFFHDLVKYATPKEVQTAIKKGADIKARNKEGSTPLMLAAMSNKNPEMIKVLLDADANIKVQDEHGRTLMLAAMCSENHNMIKVN